MYSDGHYITSSLCRWEKLKTALKNEEQSHKAAQKYYTTQQDDRAVKQPLTYNEHSHIKADNEK